MPSSQPLPTTEANLFKKILKCYELKQYRKSLQYVKEILKKFPEHGETLSMKGLILNYCNKKTEAYECAQRGLRNDVKSHVCWHVYGLLQRSDRKYDEAIKCYRNALRCDPENLQILRDLSLLQIQIRDLEGYRDTRYQLLQLRPTQRVSWIGYAMAYHLLKDYDIALNILEEFAKTQQTKNIDYEQSELLLYQNMVYREAELYEQSLKHLDENEKYILDKLSLEETRAQVHFKLNHTEKAAKIYQELIERNPDSVAYYKQLEECLGLTDKLDEKREFYKTYAEKYSRSDVPRKLPLYFLTGDQFKQAVDKYMQRAFHKGVPPLFKEHKFLYKDESKLQAVQELVLSYAHNLSESKKFLNDEKLEKEPPTSLLWVYYYLAQHFDYLNQTEQALEYINKAIEYAPTLVELYMVKGKIYKHAGNLYEAVKWLDEAQSLDTADRFINYKCSKYMLRANMIREAQEIASKFTRESTQPFDYLREMQCMWFEIECANAFRRLEKYGESLKKCHQVERHFQEIIEDQFDFHSYCMRKMTLCSYVDMLRLEDRIKSHQFFFRAAQTAIEVYLHLYDKPLSDADSEKCENMENLTPSELKKLKNKQKKQQLKAQQEKDKQMQIEQKKKELSKQKNKEDGGDVETINEEELLPEKLERPENPLEEINRFLKPLEEFASNRIETHILAFEVYSRKNKLLLMLKFLKKMKQFETDSNLKAKYHYYLCKFLMKYKNAKSTLNESVVNVIESELSRLNLKVSTESVDELNESFLKENASNYLCALESAKLIYDLNASNQKRALELVTDLSKYSKETLTLKNLTQGVKLLEKDYFGKLDVNLVNEFKQKLKSLHTHANVFQSKDDLTSLVAACVSNLSISANLQTQNDLVDKLNQASLNESAKH